MNMIEKHQSQQLVQVPFEMPASSETESPLNVVVPTMRRWYIVLITFLSICVIGIPAIWLFVKPTYAATAAIRVAPVIPSILFTDKESENVIPMYKNFMNTQAGLIKTDQVLQRVADNLVDKKLTFFEDSPNPVVKLRNALTKEDILINPGRNSELIMITMESRKPQEAAQIVNAFVDAYMAIEASKETEGGDSKLAVLESERRVLADKLQMQRQTIRQMAEEYGALALTSRQEIKLQQVASLQAEFTRLQTVRITLETQKQLLEETDSEKLAPDKILKMRYEFINTNPTMEILSNNITQLEQGLIVAKQTLAPTNPELQRKSELLDALKNRLEERRQELGETFDKMMTEEFNKNRENQLLNLEVELKQIARHEKRIEDMLAKENTETIGLGRKNLALQDQREQLGLTKDLYDTVIRRIQVLEMERKRPARISVAFKSNVSEVPSKRIKYTAGLVFGSLIFGVFLAFIRAQADHNIYTPNDVRKYVGARIIGTTTNADYLDTLKLPQQLTGDYQTIRANMELLNGGGIPNTLVITSAGTRDGKTTFAVNLATSLAKSSKKILLIDGDLRKPDIRRLLNIPKSMRDLDDIIFDRNLGDYVYSMPLSGLYVLGSDVSVNSDIFELLSRPEVSENLKKISKDYDHVIIDTPPVLGFPDALVWAKIADGVVLTTFAGRTNEQDLKDAIERLKQINANVLGTVVNSVRTNYSYNRYGYDYYTDSGGLKNRRRKGNKAILEAIAKASSAVSENDKNHKNQNEDLNENIL